ncbi:hypothetical protein SLA2020_354450 [Shorea laevis]
MEISGNPYLQDYIKRKRKMREAYLRKGMMNGGGGGFSREAEEGKPLENDGGARSPEIVEEREREFEGAK